MGSAAVSGTSKVLNTIKLGTGCTYQAKSGTKVTKDTLGCDQTCHYHDVVMVSGRPSLLTDLGPTVMLVMSWV